MVPCRRCRRALANAVAPADPTASSKAQQINAAPWRASWRYKNNPKHPQHVRLNLDG